MGVLAKYVKAATEQKRYQIKYDNWLDTGEQVTGVVFAVNKVTVPPLVVSLVQLTPDGLGVQYYVGGGVDGVDYIVTATMTTSVGPQTKIDDVFFSVREPA
jgi:hypothetical protein